ncbi:MAG: hydroxyacylglutathione hydrolase [Gammaproteobacteria bacterium]
MTLVVHMFPCLQDNYGYLVHDPETGATASIDTPDAAAIDAALAERGWRLTHILNTHHHFDHAGGNEALKARWDCTIVGAANDAARIPGIDSGVAEGDTVTLGHARARVLEVPGHTTGHIAYHFADDGIVFVGDTLFALGCGRLFEGTPAQMWQSLGKLMALPDTTTVYCAHEYTQSNARFALSVEPDNAALVARAAAIDTLRAAGKPTVPSTIGIEKATNPFLRAASPELQATVERVGAPLVDVFAETRRRKDHF